MSGTASLRISHWISMPKKNSKLRLIVELRRLARHQSFNSIRKHFNCLQTNSPSRLACDSRYQERISPNPGSSRSLKIPRHSMERPLVPVESSTIRFQRQSVIFLQKVTTCHSTSPSTRFTTHHLRRRYITYGFRCRDREPQAAPVGHVNVFRVDNQLGKVVPPTRLLQRIHWLRRSH